MLKGHDKNLEREILEKDAEVKALRDSEKRLNAILDSVAGTHWWKDLQGVYRGCNQSMVDILGLQSKSDIIGKTDYQLPWSKQADSLVENDRYVATTGIIQRGKEELVQIADGRILTFIVSKTPLYDENGNIIGVAGSSIDITYQKDLEKTLLLAKEQAETANKMKTDFVQNMQHDIRTPSAGLWGVLDALTKAEIDRNKKEVLSMALTASKRLLDLCNDAVEFGDLVGNARPLLEKALDIRDIARKVIELNLPAAFAKNLVVNFKVDTMVPPHIMSDEFRLSRILINLLGNAIKFTHEGEVSLSITATVNNKERRGLLTIEVRDTGIGIAADKIKSIYEKFTRAVASNTNKYPGTGLGLYVVRTFTDELNGDIEAESCENEGSFFTLAIPFKLRWVDLEKQGKQINERFTSPLNRKVEETLVLASQSEKKSQTKTPFSHEILIVEDDKTCLFAEKNLLSAFTSKIDSAETVTQALEKLAVKRYDLVICDLGLPDGSGCDIVAQMRATKESINHETPFVAMTAHQDEQKLRQAMNAGFSAAHTKPLTTETAVELLNIYSVPGTELDEHEGLAVIDLALGMQRIAVQDEGPAIEALGILFETLQEDIPMLQEAEKNNDIEKAREVLHKIRGGLYYSGTPRLEESFKTLHDEVKRTSDLKTIDLLFSLAYDEVKLFAEQYQELIGG